MQIPETADAGSLPLLHGDSVPLRFKTSSADVKLSMEDFFVVDRFEGQTVTLQLQVCKCQCDEQHFRRVGNSSMLYYCVWTPVSAGILALVLKLYEQIKLNCTEVNVTFVLITSGMLAASSHRYFCRIGSIFRPHYIHALHRCGLLLLMSHIAWSMCLLCV